VTDSTVASLTVNVTTPLAFDAPLGREIVEAPLLAASDTAFPLTGLPFASLRVTVTVDVEELSATKTPGTAMTVDVPALTVHTVNVTVAVCVIVMLSVASLAV